MIVDIFPLTSSIKLRSLANGNLKKWQMTLTNVPFLPFLTVGTNR